jgi:hypothetical protein
MIGWKWIHHCWSSICWSRLATLYLPEDTFDLCDLTQKCQQRGWMNQNCRELRMTIDSECSCENHGPIGPDKFLQCKGLANRINIWSNQWWLTIQQESLQENIAQAFQWILGSGSTSKDTRSMWSEFLLNPFR